MSAPTPTLTNAEAARLGQVLAQLPGDIRRVAQLRLLEATSINGIAALLRIHPNQVVRLLRYGIRQLTQDASVQSGSPTRTLANHTVQEDQWDSALLDYFLQEDTDQAGDRDTFLSRHPDLAEELSEFLDSYERLRHKALALRQQVAFEGTNTPIASPTSGADSDQQRTQPLSSNRPLVEIPGFEILGLLGEGGMGIVYLASQTALGSRPVALKMIRSRLTGGQRALDRIREEGATLAQLNDPHIVQIHAIESHREEPYLVLEFVDGGSLAQRMRGVQQSPRWAAEVVCILARTMHKVHGKNIVHRDLKPGNVLLTGDGVPKITDFGLARFYDDDGLAASDAIAGTPSYMAPEQAEGRLEDIGPATDVWALGAILYEMLTGESPFRGPNHLLTLDLVRREGLRAVPGRRTRLVFRGDEPLPGPFRQVHGEPAPLVARLDRDGVSLDTHGVALWEYATPPPNARGYVFSAEVLHEQHGGHSQVGLFCGFRAGASRAGLPQGAYYTLAYADRGAALAPAADGNSTSQLTLVPHAFETGQPDYAIDGATLLSTRFTPTFTGRLVGVIVLPDEKPPLSAAKVIPLPTSGSSTEPVDPFITFTLPSVTDWPPNLHEPLKVALLVVVLLDAEGAVLAPAAGGVKLFREAVIPT